MNKQEPDEQMVNALKLYRNYKNDLGITVTGDYETNRAAAQKSTDEPVDRADGYGRFQGHTVYKCRSSAFGIG